MVKRLASGDAEGWVASRRGSWAEARSNGPDSVYNYVGYVGEEGSGTKVWCSGDDLINHRVKHLGSVLPKWSQLPVTRTIEVSDERWDGTIS